MGPCEGLLPRLREQPTLSEFVVQRQIPLDDDFPSAEAYAIALEDEPFSNMIFAAGTRPVAGRRKRPTAGHPNLDPEISRPKPTSARSKVQPTLLPHGIKFKNEISFRQP